MNNPQRLLTLSMISSLLAVPVWSAPDSSMAAKVLSDLHHANQMEIKMGNMAKEKGQSDEVRSYGDRLVKDHTDADQQVTALAQKDGIALMTSKEEGMMPRMESKMGHHKMEELSEKKGADFDKAFAKAMVSDHKTDISKLQKAEKDLQQPDVRDLVAKLLPTLQQHLDIAQRIADSK